MSRHDYLRYIFTMSIFVLLTLDISAQNEPDSALQQLDKLISDEKYSEAETILDQNITTLLSQKRYYELADYVYYLGTINLELKGSTIAETKVLGLLKQIKSLTEDPKALRQFHLEVGSFYETLGNSDTAISHNIQALDYTSKMPDAPGQLFGLIQSNLGVFYTRIGNLEKAIEYHSKATKSFLSDETTPKQSFYINYNSLGAMMWYQSKMDSALVFFRKAEGILKEMEPTPWNQYYRTASLQNNISGIYSIQGNQDAAIQEMQKSVDNLKLFLKQDSVKTVNKQHAREFLYQAMDNYARLHKEIGDYHKAKEIITYAYKLKKANLTQGSPEISKSKVLVGQINVDLREHETANAILDESIQEFEANESPYNHWLGMAYYYKGQANRYMGNVDIAMNCFKNSEDYFKASMGEYYDEIYLDFVINASSFYAENNNSEKAVKMADAAYDYIIENQGKKTVLEYFQVLNLAEIQYNLKNYSKALEHSNRAINILKDSTFIKNNDFDRLRINALKPDAILTKTKSEFQLETNKDTSFLKSKLDELQEAISLLEEQKAILSDENSVSILLQNNNELFELAKHISISLYHETTSSIYLKKALNLHESMLYNRIRNRLNAQSSIAFANIPKNVVEKEKTLKNNLKSALSKNDGLDMYFEAELEWNDFLSMLKTSYPKYYSLRYASISKSTEDIENKVPKDKTLVRYAYINSNLYAFVIDSSKTELFELDPIKVESLINRLREEDVTKAYDFKALHELYQILWKPLENSITTTSVSIFPDQALFNLNFEMLTSELVSSFNDIAHKSLLSKHVISYNYSLFLIGENSKTVGYDSNFIAFAPEFNSEMKTEYKLSISDTLGIDDSYLTLLPQPFTKNLAKVSSRLFDGTSFLNEKASKQIFTSTAKEHKIIHIGTHAESNNISPELSRLIFAKNVNDSIATNDNSLYTFEIYNQNLASNLAILTACETGKPTYQAGEGMISLAHAFNYAGSESILTSLWKIDEKSSAEIIALFYKNISEGMAKDIALQKAKLDYISNAKGRTANPQYWAGLILIGDTSPIDLNTSETNLWYWVLGCLLLLFLIILLSKTIYKKSHQN
ncbi:CHAT domain-containing protein [Psychroserpens sp. XS_ASV72]|uniref:CHAT domain-containing protein n=1 Tax=Psychroserpens sp. XS_ASV72 TaxID=3241293 RepID=UPI003513BD1E